MISELLRNHQRSHCSPHHLTSSESKTGRYSFLRLLARAHLMEFPTMTCSFRTATMSQVSTLCPSVEERKKELMLTQHYTDLFPTHFSSSVLFQQSNMFRLGCCSPNSPLLTENECAGVLSILIQSALETRLNVPVVRSEMVINGVVWYGALRSIAGLIE